MHTRKNRSRRLPTTELAGSRLHRFKNWEAMAQANRYSVKRLAKYCGESSRQLERFFLLKFGQHPHDWLHDVRMKKAVQFLAENTPLKELYPLLGYKELAHFTNDFKKCHGVPPSKWRAA